MNYDFYLDKILLPIAPDGLIISSKSGNRTINLINDGQASIIKKAELADIKFECLLPAERYPFARYPDGFKKPSFYIDKLNELKEAGRAFQFIVARNGAGGVPMFSTNMTVTLEDYRLSESAGDLYDVTARITLREYREFKAKVVKIEDNNTQTSGERPPSTVQNAPIGIGSEVIVNGRLFKNSYGAEPGRTLSNYRGKINYINMKGSHPYHVTTPQGGWLGWVLAEAVKAVT